MESDELRNLFEYLGDSRAKFVDAFRSIPWDEVIRDRGATWGSMRGLLLHMLDVEEGWWQIALRGGNVSETPDRKEESYGSLERLSEVSAQVSALTRSRLSELAARDMTKMVTFQDRSGTWERRFDQIVMHAFVDETAHLGELIGLFSQMEVKPPYIDWLDYRVG